MKGLNYDRQSLLFLFLSILLFIIFFIFPQVFVFIGTKIFKPSFEFIELSKNEISKNPNELFILARPPQTKYDYLLVSGKNSLSVGEQIISEKYGAPIGEIVSIDTASMVARVSLFSNPDGNFVVSLNGYIAKLIGLGGGGFYIDVPSSIKVKLGDSIFLQKTGKKISKVVAIQQQKDSITNRIFASLGVNIFEISKVKIDS